MKKYRFEVKVIEYGFVDVMAASEEEAQELAEDGIGNGDYFGSKSEAEIGDLIEVTEIDTLTSEWNRLKQALKNDNYDLAESIAVSLEKTHPDTAKHMYERIDFHIVSNGVDREMMWEKHKKS